LLLVAGISALHSTRPTARAAASDSRVIVAAHGLAAGSVIGADDVRVAQWPTSIRPAAALSTTKDAVGRRLGGPMTTGEAITAARLVGGALTAGLAPGLVAVPVPLVDPGSAALIQSGDRVDLLSPPTDSSQKAVLVAASALVLSVVAADPANSQSGAQLVVAVDSAVELQIAESINAPMLATVVTSP
jgi:pilus assembly protein CpaB